MERARFDQSILALQGGGALGAYQAGVYEGLDEAGMLPTWVVGISIGSINAAIIAGNPFKCLIPNGIPDFTFNRTNQ